MMKGPFDSQVRVAHAARGWVSSGSPDVEIGGIYIDFQMVGQAVVELEIGGVLTDIWVLKLERVVLIEKLEVPFSSFRDPGVIGIEGQLSVQRRAEAKHAGRREEWQNVDPERHRLRIQNSGPRAERGLPVDDEVEN